MAPPRIQLSRARGARMPVHAVRVDRATIYGNPWRSGAPGWLMIPAEGGAPVCLERISFERAMSAAEAVDAYRQWLIAGTVLMPSSVDTLIADRAMRAMQARRDLIRWSFPKLHGRQLACWCAPGESCHADTLMEIING